MPKHKFKTNPSKKFNSICDEMKLRITNNMVISIVWFAIQYVMILQLGNTNCRLNRFCAWIAHELHESQWIMLIACCTQILRFFCSRLQNLAIQWPSHHTWPSWLEWCFLWPKITGNAAREGKARHTAVLHLLFHSWLHLLLVDQRRDDGIHNPNPKQQSTLFFTLAT